MTIRAAAGSGATQTRPALVIMGGAAAIALLVGLRIGEGQHLALAALALVVTGAAYGAAQFPLLALVGVAVITVGNLADVLIRFWGAPSINQFLLPGLAVLLVYRWLTRGERPFVHAGVLVAIAVFLLMSFLSALYAYNYYATLAEIDEIWRNMTIVFLMTCFFSYKNSVSYMARGILVLGVFCSVIAIYKYGVAGDITNQYGGFARTPPYGQRLTGTWGDPNYYGAVLVLMLPFAIDRALWSEKGWGRLLGCLAVAALVASVLLTRSRGALLAMIFGALLYGLTLERQRAVRFWAAGAVAALVAAGLLSEDLVVRFLTIRDVAETGQATDISVAERLGAWAVAIRLFFDHPLLGVGSGNFNELYQTTANDLGTTFSGRGLSPHSLYLEVLSENGLVGLTVFLGILASAGLGIVRAMSMLARRGDARTRALCAAFGVGLASHLVAMIFLHGPGARLLWIFLMTAVAMPAIVRRRIAQAQAEGAGPERPLAL